MPVSIADAAFVRELVQRRSAIVLDEAKHYLIESRLESLTFETGQSAAELVAQARNGIAGADKRIVEAITTHETSFFRDWLPFEALKSFLPQLLKAREPGRTLTVWSAACSSGQEPFSLAILLRDNISNIENWKVRILATDLSEQVLIKAREARFGQLEINRGLPASMLVRHFEKDGRYWRPKEELRRMVEFRQLNLIDPWVLPFTPDIVFLRNVLIYFDVKTKQKILERVRNSMARDGALFLGGAETTLGIHEGFDSITAGKTNFYRRRS